MARMMHKNVLYDIHESIKTAEKEADASSMVQSHCTFANCDDEACSIDGFEHISDHRAGKICVNLTGRLNNCGMVSPRFDVQLKDLESLANNLLLSRQFGFTILTTSARS